MIRLYTWKKIFDIIESQQRIHGKSNSLLLSTTSYLPFFRIASFPSDVDRGRTILSVTASETIPSLWSFEQEGGRLPCFPFLSDARPWATNHQPWFYHTFATGGTTQPNIFCYVHQGYFSAFQLQYMYILFFVSVCQKQCICFSIKNKKKRVLAFGRAKPFVGTFPPLLRGHAYP